MNIILFPMTARLMVWISAVVKERKEGREEPKERFPRNEKNFPFFRTHFAFFPSLSFFSFLQLNELYVV